MRDFGNVDPYADTIGLILNNFLFRIDNQPQIW